MIDKELAKLNDYLDCEYRGDFKAVFKKGLILIKSKNRIIFKINDDSWEGMSINTGDKMIPVDFISGILYVYERDKNHEE